MKRLDEIISIAVGACNNNREMVIGYLAQWVINLEIERSESLMRIEDYGDYCRERDRERAESRAADDACDRESGRGAYEQSGK